MDIPIKASLAVALLLAISASGAAQPSPSSESCAPVKQSAPQPAGCIDATPHKKTCVTVDSGVQLQVLDWGGANMPDTMVLLTGYGDNAHVYYGFAYQFTDYFHVIGITRRGFLPSSQPESGYDVESRAHDDIEVLKQLGISKAVFVGHSLAGSELSKLGLKYKSYVEELVYLDAFDLAKRFELPDVPPVPYITSDYRSLQIFQAAQARLENSLRPDPSACPGLVFDTQGAITGSTTPDFVGTQIFAGIAEKQNPEVNWADIDAPRLGILDQPSVQGRLRYYRYLSAAQQKVFDANWPGIVQWYADTTAKFAQPNAGKPTPVVYLLPDAPHYAYISDEAYVVRAMREFLLGTVGH
ncbi:MAG: alpha/beta hydrolase [Candidatus Korobacteraceae bacterium]